MPYDSVLDDLRGQAQRWLVTGAAGFIGSHLVEKLLALGQHVVGLDNFATGYPHNLDDVRERASEADWRRFVFIEGDIRELETCQRACEGVDFVLHHAALGSVPRSVEEPLETHASNLTGFLHVLLAARDAGVVRFVYAGSSSTYGDSAELPKVEERTGRPLSPYAVTKLADELYGSVFAELYGLEILGLRYFNVFGPRQDPTGAYAAVIPRWIGSLVSGRPCVIYGDGTTTRDFSYVSNVVQANLLAAMTPDIKPGEVYNVGCGERTTLLELFSMIRDRLAAVYPEVATATPEHAEFRPGDIRHSEADISKIERELGYQVTHSVEEGIAESVSWYVSRFSQPSSPRIAV